MDRPVAEADSLVEVVRDVLTEDAGGTQSARLGKLAVLEGVKEYPMRVKCATLAWHTLRAALHEPGGTVTTE